MNAEQLAEIAERDERSGDGVTQADDKVYQDRHDLLEEVYRLQGGMARLRSGRPIA